MPENMINELTTTHLPATCLVFKHSTRCPISGAAANEVRSFRWGIPLYWINVIEQRQISNWLAETYRVQHQSPQLIELVDGKVEKVLSHGQIRRVNFLADWGV